MPTRSTLDATPAPAGPTTASTIRSEWTKLRTLRSTWIAASSAVVVTVGFAAISAATRLHDWEALAPDVRASFDPTATALAGLVVVVIAFGSLGVHHASVEFGTGMIRQTLIATPRRQVVVLAKAVAVALVVVPVALAANVAAFVVSQAILATKGLADHLTDPASIGLLVSAALAAGALAVVGVGLGVLIRRTAAGVAAFVALLVGGALVTGAVPPAARPLLPDAALQAATSSTGSGGGWSTVAGLGLLVLYGAAATVLAIASIEHRDV